MATTTADHARPDLARHGIGDGCHAFEFPLLRQWFRQLRDLSVVAFGKDGSEFLVPVHAGRQEDMLVPAQATAQLQSAAAALCWSNIRASAGKSRNCGSAAPNCRIARPSRRSPSAGQESAAAAGLHWNSGSPGWTPGWPSSPRRRQPKDTGSRIDVWQAVLLRPCCSVGLSAAAAVVLARRGL